MIFIKNKAKKIINALLAVLYLLAPGALLAQSPALQGLQGAARDTGLIGQDQTEPEAILQQAVGRIITAVLSIVGVILLILIIYGGFLYMTAGGEEKKVEDAKKILKNSIIGLIIIFLAYAIASFVISQLTAAGNP